jgi:hypothetical protein
MKVAAALGLAVLCIAPPSIAATRCPPGKPPDWARLPSADDLSRQYPSEMDVALIRGGHVVLSCVAGADGRLVSCTATPDASTDARLAGYALNLSRQFQLRRPGCPPTGVRFNIPIAFKTAG